MEIDYSAIGLPSIADQLLRVSHWEFSWYILSLLFFVGMFMGRKKTAWLAIPASITGGIGFGMSFYSLAHHWKMMFYFWTVLIWFFGAGMYIMAWKTGSSKQKVSGLRVMEAGIMLFIVLGTFFELLFSSMVAMAFPSLLVTVGLCVVLARLRRFRLKRDLSPTPVSSVTLQ